MPYHISTMCDLRSIVNCATRQIEKHQANHRIESGESDERKDCVAVADFMAVTLCSPEQAIDKPWLAAQFGRHPAERIRDVGKGKCQHQRPEQPVAFFQLST